MTITRRHFFGTVSAVLATAAAQRGRASFAKPKTILLKSAWDTINIGDIGHTPGTLRILEQHLPEVPLILWAVALDERIEALLRRRFPRVEIVRGRLADPTVQTALARADLVIHNSSMSQDTSLFAWCRQAGKPFGLYGQSYFPDFVAGEKGRANVELLSRAAFIYCRDGNTLATLQHAGVKSPVLEFAPDGCFGIDVRDDVRALAFMHQHGLPERKFITIHLRTNTAKHPGRDNPPLNPLHPTPAQQADDERRAAVYRQLLTTWVTATGLKALIAPEVQKEMAHNKRLLFDPLPNDIQRNIVNCEEFWNADEAASLFARARACVCHEPHSLIIALANGTPILHTYSEFHSPKCWMFRDIGLADWLLEFDSTPAEKMAHALLAIHNDYPTALAKVEQAMRFVQQRQAATMRVIQGLL
jgi:polysaccharide pyruvyl transferase WcaK-like protein